MSYVIKESFASVPYVAAVRPVEPFSGPWCFVVARKDAYVFVNDIMSTLRVSKNGDGSWDTVFNCYWIDGKISMAVKADVACGWDHIFNKPSKDVVIEVTFMTIEDAANVSRASFLVSPKGPAS